MKTTTFILLFSICISTAFSQTNSCCSQIITSKTNKPFDCYHTKKDTVYYGVIKLSYLTPSNGQYGFRGQLVKWFGLNIIPPPYNSGNWDGPRSFLLDDACNIICSVSGFLQPTTCDDNFKKEAILLDICIDYSKVVPPIPPTPCTFEDRPVCGCNGITYANPCNANKAGVTKYTEGKCQ